MSPMEAQLIRELIQNEYGNKARMAGLADAAGAGLGFIDKAVTPAATKLQNAVVDGVLNIDKGARLNVGGVMTPKGRVMTMLSGPRAALLSKAAVGLGAVGGVMGAADVIAGQDSLQNKAMDTVAMGIGGFLGAAGGPVGIAAGAV